MTDAERSALKPEYKNYITILAIMAAVGIVMAHCNGATFNQQPHTSWEWKSSLFLYSLVKCCRPIFFMISGATLFEYRRRYGTAHFMKRRFVRTFIPWVFWCLVTMCGIFGYAWLHSEHVSLDAQDVFFGIVNNRFNGSYWFMVPLFAIYLSMPLLNLMERRWRLLRCMILYAFISYSILPYVSTFLREDINPEIYSPVGGGYLLYAMLGYYIMKVDFTRTQRYVTYALGVIGWGFIYFGTLWTTPAQGTYETINLTYLEALNFPNVLYAVAVFMLFKHINFDCLFRGRSRKVVLSLRASTFGIYLTQTLVIKPLKDLSVGVLGWSYDTLSWRLTATVVVFLLCWGLVQALKRVPVLRYTVP